MSGARQTCATPGHASHSPASRNGQDWNDLKLATIAVYSLKGGVGKTTTSINLGATLAEYGRRVLAVDFDPQGALSAGLGVPTHDVPTIYELLLGANTAASDVIVPTSTPGLDVIPANIDLSAAEVHLVNEVAREQILARMLRQVSDKYDVILIDCQPSLGLLIANGYQYLLSGKYWISFYPGVALLVTIVAINLVADQLRDVLNPRLQTQ